MSLIASLAATDNPLADFSDTPWWLSLVKALLVFVFLLVNTVLVIWFERRVIGRMQQRPGPNRAGPFGLLQTLTDGLKLVFKEDVTPKNADKIVFMLAPIIAGTMAFVSFSIIPMGPVVSMFGHRTPMQLTDTPVAVLLVLAVAGVGVYGIVLAGWSSGSTYPLLGGLRSTAQVISYEIAMGLSLVAVFLYSGSMSTSQIVGSQENLWFIIPAFFSFLVYVVTMVGETNRLPFDLAEGEGELTGGFHTEYSSMKFAMFFLGEYVNMFTVSALATTMFLGGWQAPPGIAAINDGMFNQGWWGLLWFVVKLWSFMFFFVWLRGSLPRVRYDQFMRFGWKFLIPVTVLWVVSVAFIHGAQLAFFGENTRTATIIVVGVISALALVVAWVWEGKRDAASVAAPRREEIDPFAGGYPVPPLPGQRLREPGLQGARLLAKKKASSLSQLLAPVAGFGVTFATMFRTLETEEYPEVKRPTQPRFHGRHQLNRHPDGLEKCVGCELCAWACPADAIYVEGAGNDDSAGGSGRFSPGERYGRVYQINYLRCIFCGLCIEACPTRALTMTNVYELDSDNRGALIFEKSQLLAPVQDGMVAAPHPMVAGMHERDYYQGKVAMATPEQRAWAAAREAELDSTEVSDR